MLKRRDLLLPVASGLRRVSDSPGSSVGGRNRFLVSLPRAFLNLHAMAEAGKNANSEQRRMM